MKNNYSTLQRVHYLLTTVALSLLISCAKDVKSDVEVYNNDFESGNLKDFTSGGVTEIFNGTHVLGRYNLGGFNLALSNLPKHKLVKITFDLFIHDSWNGNKLGLVGKDTIEGPDIWKMMVDNQIYINTTFSNVECAKGPGIFCPPQSYPANYPNSNNDPKTGAYRTDLPGACQHPGIPNWTTEYKIEKTVNHTGSSLNLQCTDLLRQLDAPDKKCDESWSVDNIKITVINL